MVVLAAAAAERIHHEKRTAVIDSRRMVLVVGEHHIRCGEVTQGFEIGHSGGGIGVEGHILGMIGPHIISGDTEHVLIGIHLFNDTAGFNALPRVIVTGTGYLVSAIHPARNLSEMLADDLKNFIRGLQIIRIVAE